MEINDILKVKRYEELHIFLSNFLFLTETKVQEFLKKNDLLRALVKKELQVGHISKAKLVRGDKKISLVSYSLSYTFFNDIEDEVGQRPNDVELGILIHFNDLNDITFTRDIVSEFGDVDYADFKFEELTSVIEKEILDMDQVYLQVMQNFFEKRLNIDLT
ncbi:hypothetical protein [Paenibacillus massiliensis]|uniref:hypothetical protein n=1 Tax=Paenibacillus massiliensis TaxID=225917 RepID=UPI000400D98F|nr:hypothetical protein [Paenibacillus massiliensis]